MSDEPLYCVRCGEETCDCSGGTYPFEVPPAEVNNCHFCGIASKTTCCDVCYNEIAVARGTPTKP